MTRPVVNQSLITEPVAWVDPATLYQLKIGLEGVHLVYETEMVNSLPLYEKPQGWSGKTENIGCLGMPVNVPVTSSQRTWVGLTDEEIKELDLSNYVQVVRIVEAKLKDKNL